MTLKNGPAQTIWIGIILGCLVYVGIKFIWSNEADCDHLKSIYASRKMTADIYASPNFITSAESRLKAQAESDLARYDLIKSCGERAPIEAVIEKITN